MKILVVSPHPDDESIGCGGTLRRHAVAGDSIQVIFLTSGEKGGHGMAREETLHVREAEAGRACAILGVTSFDFWREPDGGVVASESLVGRLTALISGCDRIYAPHEGEMHPDHLAAWQLTLSACRAAGISDAAIRGYEVWTPLAAIEEIVDISDYLDVKLAAIRAHESQCRVLRFDEAMRGLARYRGEMHSWPGGEFAEVFTGVRT